MMSRPPKPKSYTRYDDGGIRDLKIFFPSLVIGLCLGAGGMYLWHTLPLTQKVEALASAVSAQKANTDQCNHDRILALQDTDTARRALTSCRSELNAAQRTAAAMAQSDLAQSGAAAPAGQAQVQPASPSFIRLPITPKPPPGRAAEPVSPHSAPDQDSSLPQIPTPPQAVEQPAAPVLSASAPLVWPRHWPPKPGQRPAPPARIAATAPLSAPVAMTPDLHTDSAPPDTLPMPTQPAAPAQALTTSDAARINVGQEATLGGNMRIRLVAISQRNNGAFCVLAGDGFDAARIASGSNQRLPRGGHPVTLSVRVEDSDTCQVSVRPN